ncbi:MAG: hypothetical protein J5501_11245 [Ruminococcus sp.]|nr:hypothetical protein [Ruminococcus sp.]
MKKIWKRTASAILSAGIAATAVTASGTSMAIRVSELFPAQYKSGYNYVGDINGDGIIDSEDVELFGLEMYGTGYSNAARVYDIDRNGSIDEEDLELLDDFVNSSHVLGDIYTRTEGVTPSDALNLMKYLNGENVSYLSPFIDYLGDLFNRGDGLTEEDWMAIYYYYDERDAYIYQAENGVLTSVPEYIINEFGEFEKTGNIRIPSSKLRSFSLSLDGKIGLNYYLDKLESGVSKAVLSGPEGDIEYTDFESLKQTDGSYKLSYWVNSIQASEQITLSLYDSHDKKCTISSNNKHYSSYSRSINDYLSDYESIDDKTDKLVAALDNYCKAAENYFKNTTHEISGIGSVNTSNLQNATSSFAQSNMKDAKISLVLNSATALRIYYPSSTAPETVTYYANDDTPQDAVLSSKGYIEIPNIPAHKLSAKYTVKVNGVSSIIYPLNYVKRVLSSSTADGKLADVSKALYVYAQAAKAYTENN